MKLFVDTETRSPIDLKGGVAVYAEQVEILLLAWAVDDGRVRVDEGVSEEFLDAAMSADLVVAHNVPFDRTVISKSVKWMGLDLPWYCTMAQARRHGLPGGLDKLSTIFNLGEEHAKHKEGRQLMFLFCKPRKDGSWATKHTHPAEWERFKAYAHNDITSMRELHRRMPTWNDDAEREIWLLDQRINDRGFAVDTDFARTVVDTLSTVRDQSAVEARRLTGGAVGSTTQRDVLLGYLLAEHGVALPDLTASTLERRLNDDELPDIVRELLRLRQVSSKTSTAKYATLLRGISADGRMRDTLTYAGAQRTSRWAGNRFQPHNLPRLAGGITPEQVDFGVHALKAGVADLACEISVPEIAAFSVRGCVVAPPGKKLLVGDYAAIEGRVIAWVAGETWKLQAFSAFDRGQGPDLYKVAYAKAFGILPDQVDKGQRQIGKVMELMLGYEGGVGAFLTGADTYRIDLDEMARMALPGVPGRVLTECRLAWEWAEANDRTFGLEPLTYQACDALKRLWRAAHSRIERLWFLLEDACRDATIADPGALKIEVGPLVVDRSGNWLRIRLPSGRFLCYPSPRIKGGKLSYMGQNQYTRQWDRISSYGGKIAENCLGCGTEVLTSRGWMKIEHVALTDRVWDGEAWVGHEGCVYRGKQTTICAYGVWATLEHQFLTEEGWRRASSCEGHRRADVRLPGSPAVLWFQRAQVAMGIPLRLFKNYREGGKRSHQTAQERGVDFMRLSSEKYSSGKAHDARLVESSTFRSLVSHACAMLPKIARSVQELRGSRHSRLPKVEEIREFLQRCVAYVSGGKHVGPRGQRTGLLAFECSMGDATAAGTKHAENAKHCDAAGRNVHGRSGEDLRSEVFDTSIPFGSRMVNGSCDRNVYDLMNCGPRQRFVVRGFLGPLISHNCSQAIARDVMADGLLETDAAGYPTVLHVHDEIVAEVEQDVALGGFLATMSKAPQWAPGLPLAVAGFETDRYRKE